MKPLQKSVHVMVMIYHGVNAFLENILHNSVLL